MNRTDQQLLALIRASLWQKPVEEADFTKDAIEWQRIGQLALQQTVGILAFEAALSLAPNLRPPKEWIQRALAFIETNRRTHILVDKCVAESVSSLCNEGIGAVLLKGQAYACAYPRSEMRQCGDIDLYVGDTTYHKAYEAVKSLGWQREEVFHPEAKHYGCWLRGVRIELHRTAAILPTNSANIKFQQWSQSQLDSSNRTLRIYGQNIPVPTPMFDIVFVFLHLYHHFLNGGIGLRHVCDWSMLLHTHASEINLELFEKKLKEFRLMRAWKCFAPIAVKHLGLPESECPFYSKKYVRQSERVLSSILKEGNFGRANRSDKKAPEGYFAWKLFSFRRHSLNQIKKAWIDPYTISRTYGSYLIRGITRVIKDTMKR